MNNLPIIIRIPYTLEQLNQNTSNKKSLKIVKNINFENKIKIVEYDNKKNIACWWCCHTFDNDQFYMPIKYENVVNKNKKEIDIFYVYGNFCSLNCMVSYSTSITNIYSNSKIISLINYMYNMKEKIKPALPKECLKIFGGMYDISEFRNINKNSKNIEYVSLPYTNINNVSIKEIDNTFIYFLKPFISES